VTVPSRSSCSATSLATYPQDRIELGPDFQPTCMLHPDTYLNKVLLGGADGSMQLWNVASCQLVHTFGGWCEQHGVVGWLC
jgi:hypothetical protein